MKPVTGIILSGLVVAAILAPGFWRTDEDAPASRHANQAPAETTPAPASQPDNTRTAALTESVAPQTATDATPTLPPVSWPQVDTDAVQKVVALYRDGKIMEADIAASAITDPAARSVLEWAALRFNGLAPGFSRIESFLKDHPDWPGASVLRNRLENLLQRESPAPETVLAFFATTEPRTVQGQLALIQALSATGKRPEAEAAARRIWREQPLTAAQRRSLSDVWSASFTTDDHRQRMAAMLYADKWDDASDAALRAGRDTVALAEAFTAVAQRTKTAGKLLDTVPQSLKSSPEWLMAQSRFARRNNALETASAALIKAATAPAATNAAVPTVLTRPSGSHWALEQRLVARALLDDGKPKQAYEVAALPFADSAADRIDAAFFAGWIALRFLNEPEKAAGHFASSAPDATMPVSIARVAYWRGRAAQAKGDQDEAQRFYDEAAAHGTTYYGQLAIARKGETAVTVRPLPAPAIEAETELAALKSVQAARLLFKAGEGDLGLPFLAELARTLDDTHLAALADLVKDFDDARATLVIGKTAAQRGKPFEAAAFPTFGVPELELGEGDIEPSMVYAITRQESAFDGKAVSHAGARGLMQLMPATAQATAKNAGLPFDAARLTSDPAYNAQLGAAHLGELVDRWNGSYILAIASYNAGPGNVRKWIAAYGDPRNGKIDPIDWVERIPFAETRNYVQRVMENLQVYRHRLTSETALLIENDLRRGTSK